LAYLKLLTDGPALLRDVRGRETVEPSIFDHIVVDEAQDLAPLQLAVLQAHTLGATILGDVAQGVNPMRGVGDWDELRGPLRRVDLAQSYRSTSQIMAFANAILAHASPTSRPVTPFPREGESPRLVQARSSEEQVLQIAAILDDLAGGSYNTA